MRYITVSFIAGLFVAAMASTALCEDQKAPAGKELNGVWALASGETGGENMPEEVRKGIHLTLSNGKYMAKVGGKSDVGTYKVDESKTPHTLTLTGTSGPNEGKTMLAIFELDKDTLKVCYDLSGKAFPDKFESKPKTQSFLATYERQKSRKRPISLSPGPLEKK
jgi:uncharacterized protein (TIGR03067 family)